MAVVATVTYPSGVVTPRIQVHPVTIAVTGLVANATYVALYDRPGSPVGEYEARADGAGNLTLTDNPQVAGTHIMKLSATTVSAFDQFVATNPAMGTVEVSGNPVVTATYTAGL